MKKKILVVNHQMQLGGVCIAAKNFIENMKDDYEIEYMLAKPNGELDNRIPKDVKVSYINYPLNVASMTKEECKANGLKYFVKKAYIVLASRYFGSAYVAKRVCKKMKKNTQRYDVLINNDMDIVPTNFGACHVYSKNLVEADKKVLIIHGDFVANKYDIPHFEKELMPAYDYIILLSEALKAQLASIYPKHQHKFVVIPNFAAVKEIKELSKETKIKYERKTINIVSASRLTELKGIMRSLRVLKRLKDEGFDFCWNILGEGEQREEIEAFIKENNMEDNVKLWGLIKNPYPFMKAADLLYLGSYHESYGLVLVESMILGRPVVTTNTSSAKEVVDEKYGWICENEEESIYDIFKEILSNQELIKEKTNNLKDYEFDNKSIKQKYDELIGR